MERFTKEVFPLMKKEMTIKRKLPEQKIHGIKLCEMEAYLDLNVMPDIQLQKEQNRVLLSVTDIGAYASATLKVKLIKEVVEPMKFYVKLKSIGLGMFMKNKLEGEHVIFDTSIEFDHVNVDCESIDLQFESETINFVVQKMLKSSMVDVKNYLCEMMTDVVKGYGSKLTKHFTSHGLNTKINSFLPLDIPVTPKVFLNLQMAYGIHVTDTSVILPLDPKITNIDGSQFIVFCGEPNYEFEKNVPYHRDFNLQMPECYSGEFINVIANEEDNIDFNSVEWEVNGKRVDMVTSILESADHFVRTHDGYVDLVLISTFKIVYEGKIYYADALAESSLRIIKTASNVDEIPTKEQLELRAHTKNKNAHYTNMNVAI